MIAGSGEGNSPLTLAALDILEIWRELGGGELRGKRGRTFWREGDGYNVSVDPLKGVFYDHRGGGGGALDLVEVARGVDRCGAIEWLEAHCGLDARQRPSHRCADALADLSLEYLVSGDPKRAAITRLLLTIRDGPTSTIVEYREWRAAAPTFTAAMVRASQSSDERRQVKLALFVAAR
jgi:hypothetical protein